MSLMRRRNKMRQVNDREVLLERPEDVERAIQWCEKNGAVATVFFVEGYPSAGRCDCGTRPRDFIERMKRLVSRQSDVRARVGECLT